MSSESKAISIYNDVRAYTELMAMFNNNISDICVFSKNFSSDNTKMIVINNPTGDIIVDNFINNLKKIIDIENKDIVHTLGPEYAYPEVFSEYCNFDPKIVHLAKDNSKYHT